MSLMSFILIGSLLFILFNTGETISCPTSSKYNIIGMGCYKVNTGSNMTWSDARDYCRNESSILVGNDTVPNATVHLIALENAMEKSALLYWMDAYQLKNEFWVDGIASTSTWDWSNQSITWYFNSTENAIIGNGTNYKLAYNPNQTSYQISDDIATEELNYICEYQVLCNENNTDCKNDATCYSNLGQELCLCAPGFTGQYCDIDIDDCLLSPCEHGGDCIDGRNNYTCNCSNIFFDGRKCEISTPDPTQNKRLAAFWSVLGIVIGLVVILTLSDLPWEDIFTAIGCSCHSLKCCSKKNNVTHINENDRHSVDSPTNDHNYEPTKISMLNGTSPSKGMNYHIMNTVWDPAYIPNQASNNPQSNGYRSSDQSKTSKNSHIQSFPTAALAKEKPKQMEDKRIYAVNINEPTSKTKDPLDTMVNWTQQLQEQLRNKKARETSASSTKQLIYSSNSD